MGFLQALRAKYASDAPTSNGTERLWNAPAIEISGKVVEEVGFEKIRQQLARLYALEIVLLDGLCIAGVLPEAASANEEVWLEELERIKATCPAVTELDLSRNLLETWGEVEGICAVLPKLKSIRVKYVPISLCSLAMLIFFPILVEIALEILCPRRTI